MLYRVPCRIAGWIRINGGDLNHDESTVTAVSLDFTAGPGISLALPRRNFVAAFF